LIPVPERIYLSTGLDQSQTDRKESPACLEEKQTDVNMALRLLVRAIQERYDKAIIISGDTDLLPAVKIVRSVFPNKQIGLVIPIGRASEDFKQQADFHYKMREHHLAKSVFPDPLILSDGSTLNKPPSWS
jgi:uncharacterized LabA/DUF88 family protein